MLLPAALPMAASAQALSGACPVGAQVADEQGQVGTVQDTDGVGCHVKLADGTAPYYLSWMLHLVGTPATDPAEVANVAPGHYFCWAGSIYLNLSITIAADGTYTDIEGASGTWSYDPKTQRITFGSGSFAGQFAKYLGKEGIGLSDKPTDVFQTLCDIEN
ncbi:MAG: hypothetical protein GC146_10305 [Limimaricola sp.]|uniref:hypothetical protein n=1 Tax=Limimaricola sp. TaxID=2211665 RepID=UPI001E182428|nr:hypothetical protein [Limimaricola sp.]MBI1417601.1 hypothetical protein [Limimaricola sp.]